MHLIIFIKKKYCKSFQLFAQIQKKLICIGTKESRKKLFIYLFSPSPIFQPFFKTVRKISSRRDSRQLDPILFLYLLEAIKRRRVIRKSCCFWKIGSPLEIIDFPYQKMRLGKIKAL